MAKPKRQGVKTELYLTALERIAQQQKAIDYLASVICGMVPEGGHRYSIPAGGQLKVEPMPDDPGVVRVERM